MALTNKMGCFQRNTFRARLDVYRPKSFSLSPPVPGRFPKRLKSNEHFQGWIGVNYRDPCNLKGWDCDNATHQKKKRAREAALNEKLAERKDSPFCFFCFFRAKCLIEPNLRVYVRIRNDNNNG